MRSAGAVDPSNTYIVSRRIEFRQLRQNNLDSDAERADSPPVFYRPVTEIYNRRSLEELAGGFIGQARRLGTPLTFL